MFHLLRDRGGHGLLARQYRANVVGGFQRVSGFGQVWQGCQGAALAGLQQRALAAGEAVHLRHAAGVGHHLALGAAQQHGVGAGQRKRLRHRHGIFGVGVAAHQQAGPGAGVHQLDQAVRRVAQANQAAHIQQAF